MTVKSHIEQLSPFTRATLEDAKKMAFLNRFDTKYVLKTEQVTDFLEYIKNDYSVLQINDITAQNYETVYFDTPDLLCFNMHHNKRANRFKFRTRKYMNSGDIFNEIKQKINTGKTKKYRQRRDGTKDEILPDGSVAPALPVLTDLCDFDEHFQALVNAKGYAHVGELTPSLSVYFSRVTFLNKTFPERMTLDLGLSYGYAGAEYVLYNTAIVEQKRERGPGTTVSREYFRSIHKTPSGFSKYNIGISLTRDNVRKNRFLPRIRRLAFERRAAA